MRVIVRTSESHAVTPPAPSLALDHRALAGRRARRAPSTAALVALSLVAFVTTAGFGGISPTAPVDARQEAPARPFSMNLSREGDFVSQRTKKLCVAAALQIMLNVGRERDDRTEKTQLELYDQAKKLSRSRYGSTTEKGWARTLNARGVGPYAVRHEKTLDAAIRVAAAAIRRTNRPVGLLTWWGAHSWVMTGFKATADPALSDDFRVTGVYVSDPWYPLVSSIWGRSNPPDTLMTLEQLSVDYIPWVPRQRDPALAGRYVLILPLDPPVPVQAAGHVAVRGQIFPLAS